MHLYFILHGNTLENSTGRSRGATVEALKTLHSQLKKLPYLHMFRPIPKQRVETTSPGNTGTALIASDGTYVPSSGAEGLAMACCKRNRWEGKNNHCELWKIVIEQENSRDVKGELRRLFSSGLKVAHMRTPLQLWLWLGVWALGNGTWPCQQCKSYSLAIPILPFGP